jgi:hypothetical protein
VHRTAPRVLALLLLTLLVPGADELVENALHLVEQGHMAHGEPAGDDHSSTNPEHDCTGAMHLCQCCVTLSCLPGHSDGFRADGLVPQSFLLASHVMPSTSSRDGVYHPPRT